MIIEHPSSGTQKTILGPLHRLWSFLFGCIYYAVKGMWGWAIISLFTANGLLLIFPLWNRAIVRSHYEKAGWRVYEDVVAFSGRNQSSSTVNIINKGHDEN
ncbi:MAG: hypothetical protein OXI81_16885 [Paracoccaceae bacterium]|nr:hypothetical protein [Paracoccaceae bacterium]